MEAGVSGLTGVTAVKDGEDMTAQEKEDLDTLICNVPRYKSTSLNVLEQHGVMSEICIQHIFSFPQKVPSGFVN